MHLSAFSASFSSIHHIFERKVGDTEVGFFAVVPDISKGEAVRFRLGDDWKKFFSSCKELGCKAEPTVAEMELTISCMSNTAAEQLAELVESVDIEKSAIE